MSELSKHATIAIAAFQQHATLSRAALRARANISDDMARSALSELSARQLVREVAGGFKVTPTGWKWRRPQGFKPPSYIEETSSLAIGRLVSLFIGWAPTPDKLIAEHWLHRGL